jgi:hypothetical protein
VRDENYRSGADVTLEFLGRRYAFAKADFAERVAAAARALGVVGHDELGPAELDDLARLAARGRVARPRSALGRHLAEHAAADAGNGADLVYWLRKLVFRSAWLDQRIKLGLVDVHFDDRAGEFRYDAGAHALPDPYAGAPSWAAVQYRR